MENDIKLALLGDKPRADLEAEKLEKLEKLEETI